jgi:hypothetical protein
MGMLARGRKTAMSPTMSKPCTALMAAMMHDERCRAAAKAAITTSTLTD